MTDRSISAESYAGAPIQSSGPPRTVVLGLGRAGRALLREFVEGGVPVLAAWNRSPLPRSDLPAGPAVHFGPAPPLDACRRAELVLLSVRDDAIEEVAATLDVGAATLVHCSGSAGMELLASARAGARGSWHPLQAFGAGRAPSSEPYRVALEGDPEAMALGERLASALAHPTVRIAPGRKPAYHAAAVLASNALVALEAAALRVMRSAGVPDEEAWPLLRPLVRGTVDNLDRGAPADVLTGPVARGDSRTVARNLDALPDDSARAAYRVLGREALRLVQGRLPPDEVEALAALLER